MNEPKWNINYRPVFDLWPYARAAYTPSVVRQFKNSNEMSYGDDYGFSFVCEDKVIVSFQGTGTLTDSDTAGKIRDWVSNLRAFPDAGIRERHGMIIHDGFYEGWRPFKESIDGLLEVARDKEWFITGHSRGGALAAICARHIAKNRGKSCSCVTYCAPAQGGRVYRNEMNRLPIDLTNVVHGADIVPKMPPRIIGYRHAGKLYEWRERWWHYILPSFKIRDHLPRSLDRWLYRSYKSRKR